MSKTYEQALAEVQADPDKTGSSASLHQRLSNAEESLQKLWALANRAQPVTIPRPTSPEPEPVPVTQAPVPVPVPPAP